MVLTEDDYFDYLIGVTRNRELIPPAVRRALADTALLFLGFRPGRLGLPRAVPQHHEPGGRRSLRSGYAHVAVQIDPEEGRIPGPGARAPLPGEATSGTPRSASTGAAPRTSSASCTGADQAGRRKPRRDAPEAGLTGRRQRPAGGRPANPYVGPRPSRPASPSTAATARSRELLDLLIAERIVLLYSPSGAGKTSLIHAGLIPRLRGGGLRRAAGDPARQCRAAPARRRRGWRPPNRYVLSALLALEEGLPADQPTAACGPSRAGPARVPRPAVGRRDRPTPRC